jgi:outer membrane protein TolC
MKKLLILLVLFAPLAQAQDSPPPGTLAELVRQAHAYYPQLKQQQQAVAIGEKRAQIAESQYRPTLNADASYTYLWPAPKIQIPIPGYDGALQFQPHNNYAAGLSASQLLYDFGKTAANVEHARTETQLSAQSLEATKNTLAYQVATLYYGIVYLQKAQQVQQDQLKLVQETAKVIQDRIKAGDEIDYNLISTQVRYKNLETRLVDLRTQLDRQYLQLSALVGRDVRNQISPQAGFAFGSTGLATDDPMALARTNNWDLKLQKTRETLAQQDIRTAQLSKQPTLALNGATGYRNGIQPDINQFRFNGSVGVRFTAPIYQGRRYRLQEEVAQLAYQQSRYGTEAQEVTLKTGLDQALVELNAATERLQLSEAQVQQARYAVELADARLKNGVITPLDVQTSQTALEEAELSRLQYQYQQTLAQLELNRLVGTKFW